MPADELVAFAVQFAVGMALGYALGRVVKSLLILMVVVLALAFLGMAYLSIDPSAVASVLKPLATPLINTLSQYPTTAAGFAIGLLIGLVK